MELYRWPGGYIQWESLHIHARTKQSGVQRLRAQCNRDQHFRIVISNSRLEQPLWTHWRHRSGLEQHFWAPKRHRSHARPSSHFERTVTSNLHKLRKSRKLRKLRKFFRNLWARAEIFVLIYIIYIYIIYVIYIYIIYIYYILYISYISYIYIYNIYAATKYDFCAFFYDLLTRLVMILCSFGICWDVFAILLRKRTMFIHVA